MLQRLDHVVIYVRDLDVATRSYTRLLGFGPSWHGTHPEYGTANSLFLLDNTYVELISPISEGKVSELIETGLGALGEGLGILAFGTDDANATAGELRKRGMSASLPVPGSGTETKSGARRMWRNVFLPESDTHGARMFAIEHLDGSDPLPPRALTCEPAAAITALDHVVVNTSDPEAAIDLYGRKLGLRLALDRTFEKRGVRLLFFRVGGVTVEVAARLGDVRPGPDRLWGLAYRCPDVDAARERLLKEGADVSEVRPGNKAGTRVCTVKADTCGVPTLLIGPDGDTR